MGSVVKDTELSEEAKELRYILEGVSRKYTLRPREDGGIDVDDIRMYCGPGIHTAIDELVKVGVAERRAYHVYLLRAPAATKEPPVDDEAGAIRPTLFDPQTTKLMVILGGAIPCSLTEGNAPYSVEECPNPGAPYANDDKGRWFAKRGMDGSHTGKFRVMHSTVIGTVDQIMEHFRERLIKAAEGAYSGSPASIGDRERYDRIQQQLADKVGREDVATSLPL